MATVAVFIALGGGAYAAIAIPANSVGSKQLKNNSVMAKKIKNGAVTKTKIAANSIDGSKVLDGSLTGADINLATLPKVGAATNADNAAHAADATHAGLSDNATHAGTADNIAPPEAWHEIGAAGEPPFLGGSANNALSSPATYGAGTAETAGFYKDKEGVVHLKGRIKTAASSPIAGALFNLPPGYRPGNTKILWFNAFCAPDPSGCATDTPASGPGNKEGYVQVLVLGAGTGAPVGSLNPDGLIATQSGLDVSLDGITFRAAG
jgi:hypothetical protein